MTDSGPHEVAELTPSSIDENAVIAWVENRLQSQRSPLATYRLQFRAADFGFTDALEIVEYLSDLGVSHLYASPLLKARRGSSHGYDVVDPAHLNDELGSAAEFQQLSAALAQRRMGMILDVVPNHMSIGTDENAWWLDVLMHGPASRYAGYFDIDWQPAQRDLDQRVLLPILGGLSGDLLEAGALTVVLDLGVFSLKCQNLRLPLDPRTWPRLLSHGLPELAAGIGAEHPHLLELQSIIAALNHLPARTETAPDRVAERHRETLVNANRLRLLVQESPQVAEQLHRNLAKINGTAGDPRSFDELDQLLSEQAYQLVHWKAGADEMNFRRFFDVTELAAICMENPLVFDDSHRLLLQLAANGQADGFRIDHIDGLYNPPAYLWRLQREYLNALVVAALAQQHPQITVSDANLIERLTGMLQQRYFPAHTHEAGAANSPAEAPLRRDQRHCLPLFVVAEKILGADEPLPLEWPVQGTTGYDYLNILNGLFVDPRGLKTLERQYERFTEQRRDLRETAFRSKRLIIDTAMQSELQLLAQRLNRLSKRHRHSRDYTLQALRAALREIIASFAVYRTYIHGEVVSDRDRRVVQRAVALARRRNPSIDAGVFDFVRDVLLLEQPADLDEQGRAERDLFIGRMQQVTSPVMAKGMEDTAFYRDFPLASINEVGGEPEHSATEVAEFQQQNEWRQAHWPQTMLATTTHDTKRSEDVRARLNVLSEIPGLWRQAVSRWARWNRRHRIDVDGEPAPSRNDEWLFYQSLIGIWPLQSPAESKLQQLVERLQNYMQKAVHEAKLRSSWINPNPQYDAAVRDFVSSTLTAQRSRFASDVHGFVNAIADAGLYTSLSQVLLKLTSPGVADIYQGQELWDFSLVDPDNRRPVDSARRKSLLSELHQRSVSDAARRELARSLASQPRDDRLKLLITWAALQFRRQWSNFVDSRYVPLATRGSKADHLCAFAWVAPDSQRIAIVAAPRLIHTLTDGQPSRLPCGAEVWQDTAISLDGLPQVILRHAFTTASIRPSDGWLPASLLLEEFPVAIAASIPE